MSKAKKNNVLIIAPHCDDEVLGCGGYISKNKDKKNFYVLILTNANKGLPKIYSKKKINIIREEAKKVTKFLKVKEIFFEDFPAPILDVHPSSQISDKIMKYVNFLKPNEVFLPFFNDTHVDHQKTYLASITALRPFLKTSNYLKRILCYETPSETEFGYPGKHIFNPNYYVSLSKKNIDDKIKALKIYKSQIKKFPHPRSENGLKILSSYRGMQSNSNFSEAFIIIRIYE